MTFQERNVKTLSQNDSFQPIPIQFALSTNPSSHPKSIDFHSRQIAQPMSAALSISTNELSFYKN